MCDHENAETFSCKVQAVFLNERPNVNRRAGVVPVGRTDRWLVSRKGPAWGGGPDGTVLESGDVFTHTTLRLGPSSVYKSTARHEARPEVPREPVRRLRALLARRAGALWYDSAVIACDCAFTG